MARTSTCVDCGTTIIGERLRCPACHDRIADTIAASDGPEVLTATPRSFGWILLASAVVIEALFMIGCGIVLAVRGCSS